LSAVAAWDILHNCIKRKPPFPPRALMALGQAIESVIRLKAGRRIGERWRHRFLLVWDES